MEAPKTANSLRRYGSTFWQLPILCAATAQAFDTCQFLAPLRLKLLTLVNSLRRYGSSF